MIFRNLSENEESEFRTWARENYKKGEPVNPLWHPAVKDECAAINYNRFKVALEIQDAGNMRAIAREFVKVIDNAMAEIKVTTLVWEDPAVVLFVNKLESLSRSEERFSAAYQLCHERAGS